MIYRVRLGETLSSIAGRFLGDENRWPELARDSGLRSPDLIFVGQEITVRGFPHDKSSFYSRLTSNTSLTAHATGKEKPLIPSSIHVFMLADEFNPFRRKVIRRVIVNRSMAREISLQLGKPIKEFPNPEIYGFSPTGPDVNLRLGDHVMNVKPSPYTSTSDIKPYGAERFRGDPYWIDVEKAKQSGATIHETSAIIDDLKLMANDAHNPKHLQKIAKALEDAAGDKEVLVKGFIESESIKNLETIRLTRFFQVIQVFAILLTTYDLYRAGERSIKTGDVKPLASESLRQAGGWAGAIAGAELGGEAGVAAGIVSGPGAIATGFIGGVIGGAIGFYSSDIIVRGIYGE